MLLTEFPSHYYKARPEGLTYKLYSEIESAADQMIAALKTFTEITQGKELVILRSRNLSPVACAVSSTEKLGDSWVPISSDYSPLDPISKSILRDETDLYFPHDLLNPQGMGAFTSFEKAVLTLHECGDIPYQIAKRAKAAAVEVASDPRLAVVDLGNRSSQRMEAYAVFANWVIVAPEDLLTGKWFVPPQCDEITKSQLDEITFGTPIRELKQNHRAVIKTLENYRTLILEHVHG